MIFLLKQTGVRFSRLEYCGKTRNKDWQNELKNVGQSGTGDPSPRQS